MLRFLLSRLLEIPPTVLLAAVLVFGLARLAPGDPVVNALGPAAQTDTVQALRAEYGLDQPLPLQLLGWLGGALRGDLGRSILTHEPVTAMLASRLPPTVTLTLASTVLFLVVSVPLGVVMAARRGSAFDRVATVLTGIGVGFPPFFLGIVLIAVFGLGLRWLPIAGYASVLDDPLVGLRYLVLPTLTLTAFYLALTTRLVRLSILDALSEEYVRTARAKGLPEHRILVEHVLRNGLIAATTATAINVAYLLGGSIIVEEIFAIPGIGRLLFTAVVGRDFPVIQGIALLSSLVFVISSLIADVMLVCLDPRVRVQ